MGAYFGKNYFFMLVSFQLLSASLDLQTLYNSFNFQDWRRINAQLFVKLYVSSLTLRTRCTGIWVFGKYLLIELCAVIILLRVRTNLAILTCELFALFFEKVQPQLIRRHETGRIHFILFVSERWDNENFKLKELIVFIKITKREKKCIKLYKTWI